VALNLVRVGSSSSR